MVTVKVYRENNSYVFKLDSGLQDIRSIDPEFPDARITAEIETMNDFENQHGIGSMRTVVKQFFGLNGKLPVNFINSEGREI
ncbi:hypothetical protein [Paenibacillus sp. FSL E2-0178]|uniref:hypothetical protein n=1 Tax=Paenibacillus sp. FSL E2-0178 TaxID=2921361 RepID=UPI003158CE75